MNVILWLYFKGEMIWHLQSVFQVIKQQKTDAFEFIGIHCTFFLLYAEVHNKTFLPKNELLIHITCMKLKEVVLTVKSQSQKDTTCMMPFMQYSMK